MKRTVVMLAIASSVCFLTSCGGSNSSKAESHTAEPAGTCDSITADSIKNKVIDDIMSYGAKDAYVDESNYFVYGVEKADITATGDQVAEAMFPMVEEIPGIKGVKVQDVKTKEILGQYTK